MEGRRLSLAGSSLAHSPRNRHPCRLRAYVTATTTVTLLVHRPAWCALWAGRYGSREVLHHVKFSLPQGARAGILGNSGAGKSTLLSLLTRIYSGGNIEVRIGGEWVLR